MDFRVLEYFLCVAEEENISHAAELLHVSQPTISRQLMDLEEELGKKLFERTNKRVILTEDGLLFRETAQDILKLYHKAVSEQASSDKLHGIIRIGAAEVESFDRIAEKMRNFHEKHPGVSFQLTTGNATEIAEAVDKGTVDIGFILRSLSTLKYEVHDLNIRERWGILVRKDHRLAKNSFVTSEDLRQETLIIPDNQSFRSTIREWLGDIHIAVTYTLVKNAMIFNALSDYVTVCLQAEHYTDDSLVFIPLKPEQTASAVLIWKKQPVYSAVMRAFLNEFGIQNMNN